MPCVDDELLLLDDRAVGRDTFGLRSLRPFEGDRAEKRCCECVVCGWSCWAPEFIDVTELVDDLRRPPNESDSRFLRGIVVPFVVAELAVAADTWRGTREDVV